MIVHYIMPIIVKFIALIPNIMVTGYKKISIFLWLRKKITTPK